MGTETNETKERISVVELSNYEAPVIIETTGDDYVTYGVNNSYFRYINEAFIGSSTNRAVISSIAQMIYGKGLDFIDSENQEPLLLLIEDLLPAKDMRLLAMDFKQYGQCALQIGYDAKHTKILKVMHQPIMTLAKGKMDKLGVVNKYYYSAKWEDTANYAPVPIPAFGTSRDKVEILYISNYTYSSGLMYFSTVDYQSSLQFSKIEEEVSNFHLSNICNGLNPSVLLTFKDGKPNHQEQLSMETKIKAKWGGTSKAGNVMLAFVEAGEQAPSVDIISSSDLADQYKFLSELAQDKILVSHRVTSPLMFGIKDATGIGGSNADELVASYKLFNSLVINGFQEILVESLQMILKFNKINVDLYYKPLMPVDFIDEEVEVEEEEVEKETGVKIEGGSTTEKKVVEEEVELAFNTNQRRGKDGRWTNNWHDVNLANVVDAHYADPSSEGSTTTTDGKNMVGAKGMASVSTLPEHSLILDGRVVTEQDLNNYLDIKKDMLDQNPDLAIGTWYDRDEDQIYLDLVWVLPRDKAKKLGIQHNQKAIWDLEFSDEISTGGDGT